MIQRTFNQTISVFHCLEALGITESDFDWVADVRNVEPSIGNDGNWTGGQDYGGTLIILNNALTQAALDAFDFDKAQTDYKNKLEKQKAIEEADQKTRDAFATQTFAFDGQRFSLSTNAQANWANLAILQSKGWFGSAQTIATKDDRTYTLNANDVDTFLTAYMNAKQAIHNENYKVKK